MILVIAAGLIGIGIGFELGVRGTRGYYESLLDDLYDEKLMSEEDFLGYANADPKDIRATKKRIKGEHGK